MIEVVFKNDTLKLVQIILAITILIVITIYICKKKFNNKKMFEKQKNKKEIEIPLVVLNYFEKGKFTEKTFLLILLELEKKGFYSIYKNKNNSYIIKWLKDEMFELDNYDLEEYEELVISFINPFLLEGSIENKEISIIELKEKIEASTRRVQVIQNIYQKLKNSIKEEYGFLEKNKNIELIIVTVLIYYFLVFPNFGIFNIMICSIYVILAFIIGLIVGTSKFSWWRVVFISVIYYCIGIVSYSFLNELFIPNDGLITWILFFNPLLLLTICLIGTTKFSNYKQYLLVQQINSLRLIINDKLLNKKNINLDNIKKYYTISQAFNISITKISTENFNEEEQKIIEELISKEKELQCLTKI